MRLVLLKSQKFANQAGYYLLNGRWHKTSQDKPAPKGAPVSAHPHAAGKPVQKETLAEHEWGQLKLPAENVNAKTFNKQLDQLKAAAAAGDITGILGSGYGTNTYGKKLAIIANHVLGLLGSDHKVTPGQKAGTHAAVQTAPEIEAEAPAPKPEAPKANPVSGAPTGGKALTSNQKAIVEGIEKYLGLKLSASYVKNNVINIETDGLQQHNLHAIENYGTQFGKFKAEPGGHKKISLVLSKQAPEQQAENPVSAEVKPAPQQDKPAPEPEKKADAELAVPEFAEGKQAKGVKAHYEKVAKKIIRAAKAGDLSALQFMPTDKGNTWKGKTDNSKKLLDLHQAAIAHAQASKPAGKDVQHPDAEKQAAQEAKELAKEQVTPEKAPESEKKAEPKKAAPKKAEAEPKFTDKGTLANPSGYGKTFANLTQANAAAEKLKAQGHDVYVTAQHPYQVKLNKPKQEAKPAAEQGPKEGETKQGAEGTLVFKNGRWHKQGEPAKAEQKPAANEQPKGDAASKLSQIPWDKMVLPDSNKNAKSHNKQVAKIKAMAEAGDIEGLKNFKAGVNTYGKKQNLLAQTALAALEESAPAPKAEAKPAQAEKPKADDGIPKPPKMDAFNHGLVAKQWVKFAQEGKSQELMDSISTLAGNAKKTPEKFSDPDSVKLMQFAGEMANWAANNMAAPADELAPKANEKATEPSNGSDTIKNGWIDAVSSGKAPTKEQAQHIEKLKADDEESYDELLASAMNSAGADVDDTDDWNEKLSNIEALHNEGLFGESPSAPAADEKPQMPKSGNMHLMNEIEDAMLDAEEDKLVSLIKKTAGSAANHSAHQYAKAAYKYLMGEDYVSPAKAEAPAANGLPKKPNNAGKWQDTVNALEGWAKSGNLTEAENMYYDLFGLVDEMPDAMPILHYAQDVVAHIKKAGAEQGGKPQKPTDIKSVHWKSTVDEIEKAIDEKNAGYLDDQMFGTDGLTSDEAKKVHAYAKAGLEYVTGNSGSTENDGPKEGETKQGADGMLVFKNGRWHKVGEDKQPADKAAAEKPAPSSPADVEIPEFTGLSPNHINSMNKAAAALKAKIIAEGKAGFKSVLTNHKDGKVTVTIDGIKISKASVTSASPAFAAFAKFVDELKASTGVKKKAKPAPKATQAPAPAAEPEQPKQIESMDGWEQTGQQGGSNPGGKFKDENGVEWYCKFPENDHIAKAEVLAAKLYSALGLNAQDAKLVTKDGKVGIASRWVNVNKASPKELAKAPGVLEGFAADAWLANWDVVGLAYDNLQVDEKGHAMRVDAGGSLMYRAQGSKKAFGEHVTELDSMRDAKINPQAAAVFGKMSESDITASVAKVAQLSDAQIRIMVNNFGPGDKAERKALAETLIARKNDLIAKYPKSVKVKKKRLDPTKLPVKEDRLPKIHDFANWNGPGAGLSGKAAVNNANQQVENDMLAIAKSGNLTKLKEFKFQPVDIATGEPKGDPIPVAQHPSKHVQQFHQDLIQALDEIANPPQPLKIFQESDLSTLDELDMAFPSKKFGTTVNSVHSNEKMGFWVVLGGVHNAAEKFMPKKITHFTTQAIEAAYQKFKEGSKLARHFILSVQASGSYNDLFREGKEFDHQGNKLSDVAKAALEYATEQPEGTAVYRWQQMTKDMVDKIMSAPDGTVFQATGSMCTSMSPTATSHFGPHRVKIVYAKGAKAVESFGSGKFAGEKEVTTLPNSRFVIMKKEMVPNEKGSGKRLELEVLMLPPDLGL